MKKRNMIITSIVLLLLILDNKNVTEGARAGIEMCIYAVIPSLFPFMVVTGYLSSSLRGAKCKLFKPISRLLNIPEQSAYLYLIGCLGGYPTGAKCIYDAYVYGSISRNTAHRMLAFCCNAGPAFIFGMLQPHFSNKMHLALLWLIHLSGSVITAQLFRYPIQRDSKQCLGIATSLSDSLTESTIAISKVCGWVLIFKILVHLCHNWIGYILPNAFSIFMFGILELTNGCHMLGQINSEAIRFIFASFFLAFGGICVLFQTSSVIGDLNIKNYLIGKIFQSAISVIFSTIVVQLIYPGAYVSGFPFILISVGAIIMIIIFRRFIQNNSSKIVNYGV